LAAMRALRGIGIAVVVVVVLWFAVADAIVTPDEYADVEAYCAYGAVSRAQLDGCIEHVTPEEVAALRTNAAMYAMGRLDECRADAGPFCEDR
jgi:hypothetical protein